MRPLYPALIVISLFTSCIKEEFEAEVLDTSVQFSPGVAAPVGYIHYELEELFRDSVLPDRFIVAADGFITMIYEEEISSLQAADLFTINDVTHSESIVNNTGSPIVLDDILFPETADIQDTIRIPLDITLAPDAEIDSIFVDSMDIVCSSASPCDGLVSIYIQGLENIDDPFAAGIPLNGGNVSRTFTGLTIRLEHTGPGRNELVIVYIASLTPSSGIIQPGELIASLDLRLSDIDYSVVYGYLGQFDIPVQTRSFALNLYDDVPEGVFHFEEARLKIGISNSFGIPVQVEMTEFQATGRDGQVTLITGDSVPSAGNPRIIGYPSTGQEGQSIRDSIVLTAGNCNLFDVLETAPASIMFGASGTCNPAGNTHSNFLLDTSRLKVTAGLALPLYGYADFLLITDTLDFIFADFYDNPPEEIKSLTFRLNCTNGLPLNIFMQVFFADENGLVLDSLFTDLQDPLRLVPGATDTDGDGKADPLEAEPVEIKMDRERIDNISSTRYIFLYSRLTTTGYDNIPPVNVRLYTDYFFTAHLGAIAELDVNSENF